MHFRQDATSAPGRSESFEAGGHRSRNYRNRTFVGGQLERLLLILKQTLDMVLHRSGLQGPVVRVSNRRYRRKGALDIGDKRSF